MTITITNTSGSALELSSFHFDAITRLNNAPDTWSLSILSGDVTTGVVGGGSIENVGSFGARTGDGYDIDLSGLADKTFENGESVVFELAFTGGVVDSTSGGHNMMLDNMAIVAVPEPGSLALMGLGGLLIARRRRA